MKNTLTLLFLLITLTSYGQVRIPTGDRQKITEFEKRNDSLVISLENSGTNKVYLGDLRADISGKANINSPTFTGNVIVPTATISDAAINLGQMMDSLATVGTGLIQEIASTKTLTKDDAWKIFRNRSESDSIYYTIPNQANGGFTEDIGYTFYTKDSGNIFVKGQTGSGVEPVKISGPGQYTTITRMGVNTWDWSKGVSPWQSNLYTLANSANPDNEINATTGITGVTDWMPTSASSNPAPQNGLYSIKFQNGSVGAKQAHLGLTGLEIGKTYKIGIWVYKLSTTGDGPMTITLEVSQGWASYTLIANINSSLPQGVWTYYEINSSATTSTNPSIRFSVGSESNTNAAMAFDNITIEEITVE